MSMQRTYPEGVTSWIDTERDDVEATKAFYGGLLGWSFADAAPPDAPQRYVIAQVNGADAAGIGGQTAGAGLPSAPVWHTYIAVDDANAAADRVVRAGGRIVTPPTSPGPAGIWAGCEDSTGVEFRLWQAGRRLGAQITNVPSAWNFSDLHTADLAAAKSFYGAVFGWEFADLGFATMIRQPGYGDHLAATVDPGIYERQSAISPIGFADAIAWLNESQAGETPHWHVTFSVADRDAAVATVERLGGTVVSRSESEWTKAAVVRDPDGAEFTVSQFTPPE
ncbi:MAG: VOC family protein [Aldersonia sp.]|nr:VOC family protein [Aldersonia sp.]